MFTFFQMYTGVPEYEIAGRKQPIRRGNFLSQRPDLLKFERSFVGSTHEKRNILNIERRANCLEKKKER